MTSRLGGFFGVPLLSAAAPALIIAVVARILGSTGWGDFLAAQAVGTIGAIAITFGWGIYGPPAIAKASTQAERQRLYRDSLLVRGAATVVVLPAVLAITLASIGPLHVLDSLLVAGATALTGLLPSWYCIGIGKPMLMARYDVIPRVAATLASGPLMVAVGAIWPYPLLTTLALVVPTWMFSRRVLAGYDARAEPRRSLRQRMRPTVATTAIDAAGNAYGSTPVPIANASLSAVEGSAFGSADKLYRLGLTIVVVSLGNAFQGWVLEPDAPDPRRRQFLAMTAHAVTGVVGLVILAVLGPWISDRYFGDETAALPDDAAWYGVAFLFISLSTPLIRNLLIPAGRGRMVFAATMVTSVVGLVVMGIGAARQDGTVIAAGLAGSEALLLALLMQPALRLLPPRRSQSVTAGRSAS